MTDPALDHHAATAHKTVVERLWTAPVLDACNPASAIPDAVSVLVAEARCGYVPVHIIDDLPADTRVIALDPSRAMLDQARQRITEDVARRVFFVPQQVSNLSYADDVFRASICLNGISTARQAREAMSELSRVTAPGGQVTVAAPLRSAFPELFDMLDEALRAHQLNDVLGRLYDMKDSMLTSSRLADIASASGLVELTVDEIEWEVGFDSGQAALLSPLFRETFFAHWVGTIRSSDREPILRYVADAIDTYWHEREFRCRLVAGCVSGMR